MDRDKNLGLIIWYVVWENGEPVRFAGLYETIEECFSVVRKCSKSHKILQVIIEDVRR